MGRQSVGRVGQGRGATVRCSTIELHPPKGPETTTPETWKQIGVAPTYEVSDLGRVRHGALVLRPGPHLGGYHLVKLYTGGRWRNWTIHRLVATAFLGDGDGRHVNHINGVKSDNRVCNLEWCTPSENTAHALDNHLMVRSPGNGRWVRRAS
jgi:hypothetical protein